jgi:small subunit ribosomal protein S1
MAANYNEQGEYLYPEGFDQETNDWLPGYEKQRQEWERQYAEAQTRFEAHQKQIVSAQAAEAEATGPTSYASEQPTDSGTLATDEALAALREKLAGN